ncbi:hypothetical protein SKAU_G00232440 [Synaphobranchus kaupii]|uniref:Uncharacterized protein n=1 Tax=Synaphobranchus kaupii TaxID=118154 RepID=A0A9Q1F5Y4_SYNKA|nr:hypothetical protein SKAU_G00232440 [Synaphobranchus kaupii]
MSFGAFISARIYGECVTLSPVFDKMKEFAFGPGEPEVQGLYFLLPRGRRSQKESESCRTVRKALLQIHNLQQFQELLLRTTGSARLRIRLIIALFGKGAAHVIAQKKRA